MSITPAGSRGFLSVQPIRFAGDVLYLLDQRRLPGQEIYLPFSGAEEVAQAISTMVVRGAPAIGVTAAFGVALGVRDLPSREPERSVRFDAIFELLAATRPTAVNLFWALARMREILRPHLGKENAEFYATARSAAERLFAADVAACRAIGRHGAVLLPGRARVLTHCNAGALATAGFGTALGVVRAAIEAGKKITVLADETRPFLQGARLTAWELAKDGIEVTLITDNMAGFMMYSGKVDAVVVGADRIAANGDVANKIGTYSLAVLAQANRIPFYVAAPCSTVDLSLASGVQIPIEHRDPNEVLAFAGVSIAPAGVPALHPAFDVTPHALVAAIVTERGVLHGDYERGLAAMLAAASAEE